MHYFQSYFILPLFLGQIGLNYPPGGRLVAPPEGEYPMDLVENHLHLCLIWESRLWPSFSKISALFAELFHFTDSFGAKSAQNYAFNYCNMLTSGGCHGNVYDLAPFMYGTRDTQGLPAPTIP